RQPVLGATARRLRAALAVLGAVLGEAILGRAALRARILAHRAGCQPIAVLRDHAGWQSVLELAVLELAVLRLAILGLPDLRLTVLIQAILSWAVRPEAAQSVLCQSVLCESILGQAVLRQPVLPQATMRHRTLGQAATLRTTRQAVRRRALCRDVLRLA